RACPGTMIHDGWSPYDQFEKALHQQCLNHLLRRADNMAATATRGAVCFPRRVAELLRASLDLRDRHAAGEISQHGLAVARGRLENQLSDLVFPPKMNAANERLAQHLWAHRDDLFVCVRPTAWRPVPQRGWSRRHGTGRKPRSGSRWLQIGPSCDGASAPVSGLAANSNRHDRRRAAGMMFVLASPRRSATIDPAAVA